MWLIVCIMFTVDEFAEVAWGPVKDEAPFLFEEVFMVFPEERAPEFVLTFAPPIFTA